MGDFNGHSPIWGSPDINLRGQQMETLIDNHCICLLNNSNQTYFHQPTRTFHTLDLALCSPSLAFKWNFNTEDDLFNSDHFPIILSYIDDDITYPERPRKFIFQKANWALFSEFATITLDMVEEISSKKLWDKIRRISGRYNDNTSVSFLNHNRQVITDPKKIANTLAEAFSAVSSSSSYSQDFISYKKNEERYNIDFNTLTDDEYNSDFHVIEFKRAWSKSHATSPGPDNIHLPMLTHLTENSLYNILKLFNRIWKEKKFPSSWRRAVVISILKPGEAKSPNNYRPIALTSVLCKLLERMVNSRLVHVLEKKKWLSPFQSGFRFGRGTIDNILLLENSIREAFVSKKHLVSILFDMEKAYDKSWRYGILKDLYGIGFKGNLPIFIQNVLKIRSFSVLIGDTLSDVFIKKRVSLRVAFLVLFYSLSKSMML
ncbi:putative RNA-directed DNA polymerase from transposon BS [Araneus ventricosus]|uniref:Putative RNA-directed DNA polymerase from transposon BS n=1 Tax=Araneus ventricosus TaxID=182803 RepID=A0A4Y2S3K6_ARAVE|nr:putative RNA-directed DNA polymerase from transposon BS [Araneus ventricosus]